MSDVTDEEPRPPSPSDGEEAGESEQEQRSPASSGRGVREIARDPGAGQKLRRYWPFLVMAACTVALIGAIVFSVFVADEGDDDAKGRAKPAAKPPEPPMETVNDEASGFTIKYPKGWKSIPVPPGAEDLRLVVSAGGEAAADDGLWVRVIPPERIEKKVNEFAAEIHAITGGTPCGTQGSACLIQEQVTLSGMNGARFVYVTKDEQSGQDNLHIQYFLRRGEGRMYVLVFQALPRTDLDRLAPAFDQVLSSFQTSDPPSPPTTSTTAAR